MTRWCWSGIAAAVTLAGCGDLGSSLSSRSEVAAEAGETRLTAERVASILKNAGRGPTMEAAEFVANAWLDYAVFGEAVATGRIETDSAAVARIMAPEIFETVAQTWRDTLLARMGTISPGAADSVYAAGTDRVFQHIISIPDGPTAKDSAVALGAIQRALARVKGGADFGAVAAEVTEDAGKNDQGYLPVGPKGQFVPDFENVAWTLEPGQVSGVVPSQFGWHIIRRPTLADARSRLVRFLEQRQARHRDSLLAESIEATYRLKVSDGAVQAIRTATSDLAGSRRSGRTLVSLAGPDFTVGDFAQFASGAPYSVLLQIRGANDSALIRFAKQMARQEVLRRQADSAKVGLTSAQWQFLNLKYTTGIGNARRELGLDVPELSDSSTLAAGQRPKLAAAKVEDYFTRLLEGRAQMQAILPALASDLRVRGLGRVHQAGINRAVELAMAQFKKDSAAAAASGGAAPAPGIQPAPGGPPVPDSTGK
jgi:peptidyl-prolyl cis-trans isomerase D